MCGIHSACGGGVPDVFFEATIVVLHMNFEVIAFSKLQYRIEHGTIAVFEGWLDGEHFLAVEHRRMQTIREHQPVVIEGRIPTRQAINPIAGAKAGTRFGDGFNKITVRHAMTHPRGG